MTAEIPRGEPEALTFALVTAQRAGMEQRQLHDMLNGALQELTGGDPDLMIFALSQMVWSLGTIATHACDYWNQTAGEDIAGRWLADMAGLLADIQVGRVDI